MPISLRASNSMPPSAAANTFVYFQELPVEIRLIVWGFASMHPQIVHLVKKRLAVDDDPCWWMQVRSDKPVGDGEDSESDYGSVNLDDDDIYELDRQAAMGTLLSSDVNFKGTVSWTNARDFLRDGCAVNPKEAGYDFPEILYGFTSESPVPGVLLACRESFGVGRRFYSPAFSALGSIPQIYFNFIRDTLYLDTFPTRGGLPRFSTGVEIGIASDDLIQLERLAIRLPPHYNFDFNSSLHFWLRDLPRSFPNVHSLTIVDGHYTHRDGMVNGMDRHGDDYLNLKFVTSTFDDEFCWRVDGFRIDPILLHGRFHPQRDIILREIGRAHDDRSFQRKVPWEFPETNIQVIAASADKERLLHDAYLFEKEHAKGCWFINPLDPTDRDYFAGDEIDECIENMDRDYFAGDEIDECIENLLSQHLE